MFTEQDIRQLRSKVKLCMGDKRYTHTLGVEAATIRIGGILLPNRVSELRVAALLHDVAKELETEELLRLIGAENYKLSDEDLNTLPALHSFAAPALIKRDFAAFATDDVLQSVFTHTLGSADMDLFSEIIFVSDFVEENRSYESCRETAEFLFSSLSLNKTNEENIMLLHTATVMCIDHTEESLLKRGLKMNSTSIAAREKFLKLIKSNYFAAE